MDMALPFAPGPLAEIGEDGHPRRGGFLPPVELARRMWAGSRCAFHAPFRIGDAVERTSTIARVAEKEGKTGPMVFVTVRHAVTAGGRLAMEEEQDIVFLDIPARFSPPAPTPPAAVRVERDGRRRPRHAVPLLGPDLQRPPHPLRPPLRD